ncbi:hypothetical protein [Lentzea sp. NPDC055074]
MSAGEKGVQEVTWRHVVDGWVTRTQVRRDLMIALAMTLLATVAVVALLTGFLGVVVPQLLSTPVAKAVAAGALASGSIGAGLVLRRRRASSR